MQIQDYKPVIGQIILIKNEIAKLDTSRIWPYHLPEIAASNEDIQMAETQLGHRLDSQHKSMLLCANGWKGFYQWVDLFGTEDLASGPKHNAAKVLFDAVPQEVFSATKIIKTDCYIIAASQNDRDVFVMGKPATTYAEKVFWFAGDLIEQFENFDEYFLTMSDYNKMEVSDLLAEQKQSKI